MTSGLTRRRALLGLLAAPAIVRVSALMPISIAALPLSPGLYEAWISNPIYHYDGVSRILIGYNIVLDEAETARRLRDLKFFQGDSW